jgi:hypothetical protein
MHPARPGPTQGIQDMQAAPQGTRPCCCRSRLLFLGRTGFTWHGRFLNVVQFLDKDDLEQAGSVAS